MARKFSGKLEVRLWIGLAVLLVLVVSANMIVQIRLRQELASWIKQCALDEEALNHLNTVLHGFPRTSPFDPPSLTFAEKTLNGGRPLEHLPADLEDDPLSNLRTDQYAWTNTQGGKAILLFAGPVWVGVRLKTRPMPEHELAIALAMSSVRRWLYLGLALIWLIGMLQFCVQSPHELLARRRGALRLLGLATGTTILALTGMAYWRAWNEFSGDDPAGWACAALVISLLVVANAFFVEKKSDGIPRCTKCRYILTGNTSGICPACGTPIPGSGAGQEPI